MWHKVVDYLLKALVSNYKVLPNLKVEFSSVHVNVKSARVVNLSVAEVEDPADFFKFLNFLLSVEDWANKFECIVTLKAAVCHQLPMVSVIRVVVAFNLYSDACCVKFSCKAFSCAVVSFNLDSEVAVESVGKATLI